MIAFCLWAEGFSDEKKLKEMREYPPGRFEVVGGQYKIDRREIPSYFTEEFWNNLTVWDRCSQFGMPHDGGWAKQSSVLVQMLQLFDAAKSKIEKMRNEEQAARINGRMKK